MFFGIPANINSIVQRYEDQEVICQKMEYSIVDFDIKETILEEFILIAGLSINTDSLRATTEGVKLSKDGTYSLYCKAYLEPSPAIRDYILDSDKNKYIVHQKLDSHARPGYNHYILERIDDDYSMNTSVIENSPRLGTKIILETVKNHLEKYNEITIEDYTFVVSGRDNVLPQTGKAYIVASKISERDFSPHDTENRASEYKSYTLKYVETIKLDVYSSQQESWQLQNRIQNAFDDSEELKAMQIQQAFINLKHSGFIADMTNVDNHKNRQHVSCTIDITRTHTYNTKNTNQEITDVQLEQNKV